MKFILFFLVIYILARTISYFMRLGSRPAQNKPPYQDAQKTPKKKADKFKDAQEVDYIEIRSSVHSSQEQNNSADGK